MFFSLFHIEPHLLSLHFLSQDTAFPRRNPSGRPISFRGNSNHTHKGVIGPVPCPQRKDPTFSHAHSSQAHSSLPFPLHVKMQVPLKPACPRAPPSQHKSPNTFYEEKHKTPERTQVTERGQTTFIAKETLLSTVTTSISVTSSHTILSMGSQEPPS